MKFNQIKAVVGICLLFTMKTASADLSYLYGVYISTVHDEVRANVSGLSYLADEMDRVDVFAWLYVDDLIDIDRADNNNSCLRISTETISCHTRASYSPVSAGCKYCGDFRIQSLRNNETNPNNPPDW